MEISSNTATLQSANNSSAIKPLFTEKLTKDEVTAIKEELKASSQMIAFNSASIQNQTHAQADKFTQDYESFQSFLQDVGYEGKPIAELSQDEAAQLVSEDGFFGVTQTSERIANFVINGSGGDEDRMRAGREGMIQGFKQAEEMWGGELPEISQQTMQKAIEMVDNAMHDLGYSIINEEA